jgi:hypothetical protein
MLHPTSSQSVPLRYWARHRNIGDLINPYIVDAATGLRPYFTDDETTPHVLGIGSIFFLASAQSHIWGSGILDPSIEYGNAAQSQIHAVRGRLTRDLLRTQQSINLDVPLGDPGIFADEIPEIRRLQRNASIKYKVALIPHHDHANDPYFQDMAARHDGILLDTRTESLGFIDTILSSEMVISQSLHGLIFAELFGKPNVWLTQRHDAIWTFKFRDWFSNTHEPPTEPEPFGRDFQSLSRAARLSGITIDRESLRAAMPRIAGTDRTGCMGFRECRAQGWISVAILTGTGTIIPDGFDETITLDRTDPDALRVALGLCANRRDEWVPALLAFDPATYESLGLEDITHLRRLLNDNMGARYLAIPRQKPRGALLSNAKIRAITPEDYAQISWTGVIYARHLVDFRYSAPGLLIEWA